MNRTCAILVAAILVTSVSFSQSPYFHALRVKDIDASITWYCEVLGLNQYNRVDSKERGFKQVNLQNEFMLIELVELVEMVTPDEALKAFAQKTKLAGIHKVRFLVDEIEVFHNKLEKLGVEFYGNIVKDVVSGNSTFLVKDPDGNILQFFEK
jgi:catechol 2,3-dioxygenase-like lactoylglutathione lyase family enzyme